MQIIIGLIIIVVSLFLLIWQIKWVTRILLFLWTFLPIIVSIPTGIWSWIEGHVYLGMSFGLIGIGLTYLWQRSGIASRGAWLNELGNNPISFIKNLVNHKRSLHAKSSNSEQPLEELIDLTQETLISLEKLQKQNQYSAIIPPTREQFEKLSKIVSMKAEDPYFAYVFNGPINPTGILILNLDWDKPKKFLVVGEYRPPQYPGTQYDIWCIWLTDDYEIKIDPPGSSPLPSCYNTTDGTPEGVGEWARQLIEEGEEKNVYVKFFRFEEPQSPFDNEKTAHDFVEEGHALLADKKYYLAIQRFKTAVNIGLSKNEEIETRLLIGETQYYMELQDKKPFEFLSHGVTEMERAVKADEEQEYRYFSNLKHRRRLQLLDSLYAMQAITIAKEEGIDSGISYLQNKVVLFKAPPDLTKDIMTLVKELPDGGVWFKVLLFTFTRLGQLYERKGDYNEAERAFRYALNTDMMVNASGNQESSSRQKMRQAAREGLQRVGGKKR